MRQVVFKSEAQTSGQYLSSVGQLSNELLSFLPLSHTQVPAPPDLGLARPAQGHHPSFVEGAKPDSKGEPTDGKEVGRGLLAAAPVSPTGPGLAEDTVTHLECTIWESSLCSALCLGAGMGGLQAWPPNRPSPRGCWGPTRPRT